MLWRCDINIHLSLSTSQPSSSRPHQAPCRDPWRLCTPSPAWWEPHWRADHCCWGKLWGTSKNTENAQGKGWFRSNKVPVCMSFNTTGQRCIWPTEQQTSPAGSNKWHSWRWKGWVIMFLPVSVWAWVNLWTTEWILNTKNAIIGLTSSERTHRERKNS